MMRISNKFVCALVLSSGLAQAQENYTIKANIGGNSEGKMVYLISGAHSLGNIVLDSAKIRGGRVEFAGNTAKPLEVIMKVFVSEDRKPFTADYNILPRPVIPLLVASGTIDVEAKLEDLPLSSKMAIYDLSKISVSGSKLTKAYFDYIAKRSVLMVEREKVRNGYKEYLEARPAVPIAKGMDAISRLDRIDNDIKAYVGTFIRENRDNLAALKVFYENLHPNIGMFSDKEIDDVLGVFTADLKSGDYFKMVDAKAQQVKRSVVGKRFLDLEMKDINGKPSKLSDFVGKGKYVLVDFWGPWCIPCRKEFPYVKERYAKYHPEGFEIIGISVDSDKVRWPKAMDEEKLPWPQFALTTEGEESKARYNYDSIPFCVLIDPQGNIVDRNMLGTYLDRKLIELYGDKINASR